MNNRDDILSSKIQKIDHLLSWMASDTKEAFRIAKKYPRIAKLFTIADLVSISGSPVVHFEFARDILDILAVGDLIKNKSDFIKISQSNIYIGFLIYADIRFKHFADETRHLFHPDFNYLSRLYHTNLKEQKAYFLKQRNTLQALNLMSSTKSRPRPNKNNQSYDRLNTLLDDDVSDNLNKLVIKRFGAHHSIVEHMMYDQHVGYYSSGKVNFHRDFTTFVTGKEAQGLATMFASQLFFIWQNLKGLLNGQKFNVLEGGAGNGDLCFLILQKIELMAQKNPEWKVFNDSLHYYIVDRSTALNQRQKERTHSYRSKITIINADISKVTRQAIDAPISAVISNELLDMFTPQSVHLNQDGKFTVPLYGFCTIENLLKEIFIPRAKADNVTINIEELKRKSKENKAILKKFGLLKAIPDNIILLSQEDYFMLHRYLKPGENNYLKTSFMLHESNIDVSYFPSINEFMKRNKEYFASHPTQPYQCLDTSLFSYLKAMHDLLIPGGEIISIDYGDDMFAVNNIFKSVMTVNGEREVTTDILENLSNVDITHNIDFTTCAVEGDNAGVETIFYGKQSQLLPTNIPEDVLNWVDRKWFNMSDQQSRFHVLVQRKPGALHYESDKHRFNAESKPLTQSQLFHHHKNKAKTYVHEIFLDETKNLLGFYLTEDYKKYLDFIVNKNYSAAFRKICSMCDEKHIDFIMAFIKHLDPKFDVNQPSSNGKTAADWVAAAKVQPDVKQRILAKLDSLRDNQAIMHKSTM